MSTDERTPGLATLRGRVTDSHGTALAGVTVVASAGIGVGSESGISEEDGRFEMSLEPGDYTLAFYYSEFTV